MLLDDAEDLPNGLRPRPASRDDCFVVHLRLHVQDRALHIPVHVCEETVQSMTNIWEYTDKPTTYRNVMLGVVAAGRTWWEACVRSWKVRVGRAGRVRAVRKSV